MHLCKQPDVVEPWPLSNCGHGGHGSANVEMHIMVKNRLPVAGRPATHYLFLRRNYEVGIRLRFFRHHESGEPLTHIPVNSQQPSFKSILPHHYLPLLQLHRLKSLVLQTCPCDWGSAVGTLSSGSPRMPGHPDLLLHSIFLSYASP